MKVWKRLAGCLLAGCMCFSASLCALGADEVTVYVNQNFDEVKDGLPGELNYNVPDGSDPFVPAEVKGKEGLSLKISGGSTGIESNGAMFRAFPKAEGKVIMEASVMLEDQNDGRSLFQIFDEKKNNVTLLTFDNSGDISMRDDKWAATPVQTYNTGEWYTIQIMLDMGTKKMDILIDGDKKVTQKDIPKAGFGDVLNEVRWTNS